MKIIIDRFEGDYAVCEKENSEMLDIEKHKLPLGAKEGDVIIISEGSIKIDEIETRNRKEKIQNLMDSLWK